MPERQYVGARYVPKFYDYEGSSEWRENTAYENLIIVTRGTDSYTSKKPVPSTVGTPENNPEYWAKTGIGGSTGGLDTRVTALENRVSDDEANISNISASLQTTITNLSALTGRVTSAESDIDSLESGLQSANSNISSVTNRVTTAEGDIDALETRVGTAESDIDTLESGLQSVNSNISSVTGRVTTAEGDIDALEARVATAESNITALQTLTDDLQYMVNNIMIEMYSPDRYTTNN